MQNGMFVIIIILGATMKNNTKQNAKKLVIKSIPLEDVAKITNLLGHEETRKYAFNPQIRSLESKADSHYIVNFADEPISVGYMHVYFPFQDDTLWIQTFVIDKAYVRKGLGTAFFNLVINNIIKNHPINLLYLACHEENESGILFWESLGFIKRTNMTKQFLNTNEKNHIIIYEKKLVY